MRAGPILETILYARDLAAARHFYGNILGLDAYRAIAADARRLVVPGGFMVLEVGAGQAQDVTEMLVNAVMTSKGPPRPDMAGIARAVVATHVYVSG